MFQQNESMWTWPRPFVCLEHGLESRNKQEQQKFSNKSDHIKTKRTPTAISISVLGGRVMMDLCGVNSAIKMAGIYSFHTVFWSSIFSCVWTSVDRALAKNDGFVADWCDDHFFLPDVQASHNNVYAHHPRSYHYSECRDIMKEQKDKYYRKRHEKTMQLWQHQWNLKTPTSFRVFVFYFISVATWDECTLFTTQNTRRKKSQHQQS